ncbi:MAG: flagellar basal-body rod protein FlgG [Desulfotomaculum sp.]|nr:flagellar basal-body rod protein FlgG [Desulfotomaculum sp.]
MLAVIQTGRSALIAQQTKMSVIGNNIANINTTAFKRDRINFCDIVRQEIGHKGVPVIPENKKPVEVGHGVKVASINKVFEQGVLKKTDRTFDLAIDGEGFFALESGEGQVFYTREGAFFMTKDGYIVNSSGFKLLGIKIPPDAVDIIVESDGKVKVIDENGEVKHIDKQIALYRFENISGLKAVGSNLFLASDVAGAVKKANPGEQGFGLIKQGYLEMSNVDLAIEMVNMIEAQRAYAFNSRLVSTADEIWRLTNDMKRS